MIKLSKNILLICLSFAIFLTVAKASTLVCNVKNFGAKGNGQLETITLQKAVDACTGKGGTVYFPPGNYLTGTLRLGSNMTLHLDQDAKLVGVRDRNAYPWLTPPTTNGQLLNCRRALIYAESADNLTIEGPGSIDGSGDFSDWKGLKEAERPMAIFVVQGVGLHIQNLEVKNSAMWSVVLMETKDAHVSKLNIDSRNGGTRDGIDIVDGSDIHLDNITVFSEDDSICLKSGIDSGLSHVTVTNSQILGSLVANGIKFGTASKGILSDVRFENITINNVAQAAMAIESVDGSHVDGVKFKNIKFRDTGTAIFVLLGWRGSADKVQPGTISNLSFEDIDGESSRQSWGSAISGTNINGVIHSPAHMTFKNIRLRFKGDDHYSSGNLPSDPPEYAGQYPDPRMWTSLPSQGLYFRHVKDIEFENVQLEKLPSLDLRPLLVPLSNVNKFDAP
ncbi:MAG: glycoside hydrolase family 28 protein [Bdellovibrio sp.]